MTNALVGQFLHTEHHWPQRPAHRVQQVGQRHVKRAFVDGSAGASHQAQLGKVGLNGLGELTARHSDPIIPLDRGEPLPADAVRPLPWRKAGQGVGRRQRSRYTLIFHVLIGLAVAGRVFATFSLLAGGARHSPLTGPS